jgi:hypothetical protein
MLNETIYGNVATVYHRTNEEKLIDSINKEGFKVGGGDYYGRGFYATYDLESQLTSDMQSKYGQYVVKFGVNLSHFFFFDYNEFVKTPLFREHNKRYPNRQFTEQNFIDYQFLYYKMLLTPKEREEYQRKTNNTKFTSDVARECTRNIKNFTLLCAGIVFTGRQDGLVLVAYRTGQIKPLSYVETEDLQPKILYLECSLYGEIKDEPSPHFAGYCQYSLYYFQGDDYDIEENATNETSSSFDIYQLLPNEEPLPDHLDMLNEFEGFNINNGRGLYIEYTEDYTMEDAEREASRIWTYDESMDIDSSELELERNLKEYLDHPSYDYIIVKQEALESWMEDFLSNNFKFYNKEEFKRTKAYIELDVEDYSGNTYNIYYQEEYNRTKRNNDDWVSTAAQRKYDHQLDLDYGL